MVVGIIMGRAGSVGFPGKNTYKVCGKPMIEWVLESASEGCDEVYLTTDCDKLKKIGKRHGARIINRPPELCTSKALGEDVYLHAVKEIDTYYHIRDNTTYYVLMMANSPTFKSDYIWAGVECLDRNQQYDSACSVSKYNMYSPSRMRCIENKCIAPATYSYKDSTCDRDSLGDFYIYDCSVAIVREKNLDHDFLNRFGIPPQRWLGTQIYPIINEAGIDVDYEWQIGQVEWWLKNNGMV